VKVLSSNLSTTKQNQIPLLGASNPRYSGGRDQEDHNLKQALSQEKTKQNKKPYHKKGLVEWLKV
jgi:hypothetical protein